MATKKTRKKSQRKTQNDLSMNIMGLILAIVSLLAVFKPGFLGSLFANTFRMVVGDSYTAIAIITTLFGFYFLFFGDFPKIKRQKVMGGSLIILGVLLSLSAYTMGQSGIHQQFWNATWQLLIEDFAKMSVTTKVGGGMIGAFLYTVSYFLVSQIGSYIIVGMMLLAGIMLIFNIPFKRLINAGKTALQKSAKTTQKLTKKTQQNIKQAKAKQSEKPVPKPHQPEITREQSKTNVPDEGFTIRGPEVPVVQKTPETTVSPIKPTDKPEVKEDDSEITQWSSATVTDDDYQLPSTTLLTQMPASDQSSEYQLIEKNQKVLKTTFESFGVDVTIKSASLGPSVTKYEIAPAVGVKVSKIVNLADDLALALAAKDIRIEAPIPGKPYVGIEVPNQQVSTVNFRDMVEQEPPHPGKPLAVPLGKDISGKVIMSDLSKMPHLLIAGSTGSGKSVAINGIITSILMSAKPDEVKLMLIDPKMVELNVYEGIPHLLIPVVTNAKKAANALNKVVQEMERRYQLFADSGQRNMGEYNDYVRQQQENEGIAGEILPYIVVIVDELSDLMMVASSEVESAIIRLAQMARAAGIHMIVATQRPSVDVITGLIKANIPSRIAFAVSSGIDSRTILDSSGAEKLLGKGDMLYMPIGMNKPIRVQGAFISSRDVETVVSFITQQQKAEYDEAMIPSDVNEQADNEQPEDEYYQAALELIIQQQGASVSMLQRRFRIGYNRAARLIDEMENRGIVGPAEGSKPRKVMIDHLPNQE